MATHSTLHLHIPKDDLTPLTTLFLSHAQTSRAPLAFPVLLTSKHPSLSFTLSLRYTGSDFCCYESDNAAIHWPDLYALVEQRSPILGCWLERGGVRIRCRVVLPGSSAPTYNYWVVRTVRWKEKRSWGRWVRWVAGKVVVQKREEDEAGSKRDSESSGQSRGL
ncbi:hypothetical protein BDV95DRAFT_558385 [Massariosphaeria phaeospora]|uniref:Uncharacterized protein n=1 Tax=Massariosphaeria phaeospora TaxID=100035 RepID=A0A7C8IP80_9PLEO|nr:hypothetical protein BDV95DRAFT_558385 [Massariosphaeria phaeospora]